MKYQTKYFKQVTFKTLLLLFYILSPLSLTTHAQNDTNSGLYNSIINNENTKIFNWCIQQNEFNHYLAPLHLTQSFFVPTDNFFNDYIDPLAFGKEMPGVLKFWFNNTTSSVCATIFSYNELTSEIGDSINVVTNEEFVANRLFDVLRGHLINKSVESGNNYYLANNNDIIKVSGNGLNLKVQGGGDIKQGSKVNVTEIENQTNGTVYFIDKPISSSRVSVYKILSETPEFNMFYQLLWGFPSTSNEVFFVRRYNHYGIDNNIRIFSTYNYTIYVPTNEAINEAINKGLIKDWDQINTISDATEKLTEIERLASFIRYHIQDNAVFVGNQYDSIFNSNTIKCDLEATYYSTHLNRFYKLGVTGDGNSLTLTTENNSKSKVVIDNGLYNIIAKEYTFNSNPSAVREIDGSGSGNRFDYSRVVTTSSAVIHQIDNILLFKE